jgi:hypothetical protein
MMMGIQHAVATDCKTGTIALAVRTARTPDRANSTLLPAGPWLLVQSLHREEGEGRKGQCWEGGGEDPLAAGPGAGEGGHEQSQNKQATRGLSGPCQSGCSNVLVRAEGISASQHRSRRLGVFCRTGGEGGEAKPMAATPMRAALNC